MKGRRMPLPTDIRVKEAVTRTRQINYRTPIKFGGRVVADVTMLDVRVVVETRDGRRGVGYGSMPIGNAWGWPSQQLSSDQTRLAMQSVGQVLVDLAPAHPEAGHPLQIVSQLAGLRDGAAADVVRAAGLGEPMPKLAQLVAASPLEAAIFDAFGQALQANVYDLLHQGVISEDLSHWLGPDFRGEYLDQYTRRRPQHSMHLYHLVGALDPLSSDDVTERINDGIPETLEEWIRADGLTHLKIKLSGDDLLWDVQRVLAVENVALGVQTARGCDQWYYSLDFNEKCRDVAYVMEFLHQLTTKCPEGFRRVQYIEQPTHRDLKAHRENRMHEAAAIKPVVIDESLVDLESLLLSRELGYSGVALKACKGHGEALLMGAAAQKYAMFLCVQDLTCTGASFLHSASLAARVPTVVAIEGNGRQYCPVGNRAWRDMYPEMFQVTDGTVGTYVLDHMGLGFRWPAGEIGFGQVGA
jgi:L-alanine-DL-glutamate epimerase-like enolase superfamily enzyme